MKQSEKQFRFVSGTLPALLVACMGLTPAAGQADVPRLVNPRVRVVTDREGALYARGDTAKFIVTVTTDGNLASAGTHTLRLIYADGQVEESTRDLADGNPFEIETTLDKPGFVKCAWIGANNISGHLEAEAVAGFDVEKIVQGYPEPEDFEQYWNELLKRQNAIENAVQFDPLPDDIGEPGFRYFRVKARTVDDGVVYGYLGVPADLPGPFPAMVIVAAAGPGYNLPEPTFIRPDMITLTMNVHPVDTGLSKEEYQARFAALTAESPYWLQGGLDRERYYFRNAILGNYAAIQALIAHPAFDGGELLYLGSSQGGGMGLILGGLIPRFTAMTMCVPALCDHGGSLAGRGAGWPNLVHALTRNAPELREQALDMSAYFDAVNFAKRIQSPVLLTVGFRDNTCPPSSIYAAYNAIPTIKHIMTAPASGHAVPWEHLNGMWQWIQNRLDETHRSYRAYYKW